MIKTFLFYLGIFVIGSLIVSSIIDPQVYSNLKDKGTDVKNSFVNFFNIGRSIEVSPNMKSVKTCDDIEAIKLFIPIPNMKKGVCQKTCAEENLEYSSYSCRNNLFTCYCK